MKLDTVEMDRDKIFYLLPDGVSGCSWNRRGRGREAAVSVEILYGPTPGGVDGRQLPSGLGLLPIKPGHTSDDLYASVNIYWWKKMSHLKQIKMNEKVTCVTAY